MKETNNRLRSSYLSTVISIALVLFMIGLLGMLVLDAKKISEYVKEHVQLNVFLKDEMNPAEISAFQNLLLQTHYVRSVEFVSKEQALDSLRKDLGEDAVKMLETNPLPASFELRLKADYTDPENMKSIAAEIQKNKFVREVTYQQTEVKKMNENFRTVAIVIILFSILLFFIAAALINNTIRLSMHSRRFLIKSMQLVGATKGFIRMPFLSMGMLHGLYAGLTASVLLAGLLYLIRKKIPELIVIQDLKIIGILFAGIIIFGILLSLLSTFFAVNRYLRMKPEELYG